MNSRVRQLPGFLLYARDWLTSERRIRMRPEAKGMLVDLMCHAWLNGSLPTDERELAHLARLELGEFKRIWPKIEGEWQVERRPLGDRYVHPELEVERQRQLHFRALQAARRRGAGEPDGPEQLGLPLGQEYGVRSTKRGAGSGERGAGSGGTSRRPAKSLGSRATAVAPTTSASASTSDPPLPPQGDFAPTGPGETWPERPLEIPEVLEALKRGDASRAEALLEDARQLRDRLAHGTGVSS